MNSSWTVPIVGLLALVANTAPVRAADGDGTKIHRGLVEHARAVDGPVKAWVFFADKGLSAPVAERAALRQLESDYPPRAVERRRKRRTATGLFDTRDLPVHEPYVAAVVGCGAARHVASRWLNAVSVWLTAPQARQIAALPFVRSLEPVRVGRLAAPPPTREGASVPPILAGTSFHGESLAQLAQIGLIGLHETGHAGDGVVVGVLDTGFSRTHDAFNDPDHPLQVLAEYDFIDQDSDTGIEPDDPGSQHRHGTLILGLLGAYQPGVLVGAAYDATFILCKTEDTTDEYVGEEDNFVAGLEFIEQNGGDVATSSLGYIDWYTQEDLDGLSAITTVAVNTATENGVFCCTAAGNSGHDDDPSTSRLIAPADALAVITCGAVDGDGAPAGFSSDGPSADGRVKPELLALGVGAVTVSSENDAELTAVNGTSASTPLVAGVVACLTHARSGWSVEQMREMLFATAGYAVEHGGPDPLFVRGYGVVDAQAAADLDCNGNGAPDAEDLDDGTSVDTNGNTRPDECDADIDGSGSVDVDDLVLVILAWGPCPGCPEDADGNGVVDVDDLVWVILNWS